MWVKIKPPGYGPQLKLSMLPFTEVPFWVPIFDPQTVGDFQKELAGPLFTIWGLQAVNVPILPAKTQQAALRSFLTSIQIPHLSKERGAMPGRDRQCWQPSNFFLRSVCQALDPFQGLFGFPGLLLA